MNTKNNTIKETLLKNNHITLNILSSLPLCITFKKKIIMIERFFLNFLNALKFSSTYRLHARVLKIIIKKPLMGV